MSFQGSIHSLKSNLLVTWCLHFAAELMEFYGVLEQQFVVSRETEEKKEYVLSVLIFKGIAGFYRNISKYLLLK